MPLEPQDAEPAQPRDERRAQAWNGWRAAPRVYRAVTIAFTLWMCFWVPLILLTYGPANFLWLCNISKFLYIYALWNGHRLLASSQAGLLVIVGSIWTADLLAGIATGGSAAVMTHYMWLPEIPLLARLSSLYHVFLPPLAIFMVYTLGYDRRGPWLQTGIGAAALLVSALFTAEYRKHQLDLRAFQHRAGVDAPRSVCGPRDACLPGVAVLARPWHCVGHPAPPAQEGAMTPGKTRTALLRRLTSRGSVWDWTFFSMP